MERGIMNNYENEFNSWLLNLNPFSLTKNDDLKKILIEKNQEIFDFTIGDPKEPTPEFIRKALSQNIDAVSQYPLNNGSLELRQTCSNWAQRRLSVDLNPNLQIITSNGSKEAIFHIPQILFNAASAKKIVVFPEPGYPVYKAGTILAGGVPYAIPLSKKKNYVFDPQDIPNEIAPHIAAVWLCYPHNPTGATISFQQMQEIYEWALKFNIILLSDECYIDMFYQGKEKPHSFLEIAKNFDLKNLICFFSLSKRSGMTGYRSGFVAGQTELISLFAKYRLNVGLGTPDFVQKAAVVAWQDDKHVLERNSIFKQKRDIVDKFCLKNKIKVLPSNATFYVWGEIPKKFNSDKEFIEELFMQTGILLTAGSSFGNSCFKNFRMALVPTVEKIKECLEIWQEKIDLGEFKL